VNESGAVARTFILRLLESFVHAIAPGLASEIREHRKSPTPRSMDSPGRAFRIIAYCNSNGPWPRLREKSHMNKPIVAGVAIAALGIIAAVAIAARYGFADNNSGPEYAQVVSVQPVKKTTSTPHEVCGDETVVHKEEYKDKHQIGGAAVGAVAGALVGHQIGGGKGKDLATIAGAVGGGIAGHEIQKRHQENNPTYTTVEHRCHTVTSHTSKTIAYDVTYEYQGEQRHVRLDHDPGTRVQVSNGVVIADNGGGNPQPE
jgi:uncharacterized protein YcfJ